PKAESSNVNLLVPPVVVRLMVWEVSVPFDTPLQKISTLVPPWVFKTTSSLLMLVTVVGLPMVTVQGVSRLSNRSHQSTTRWGFRAREPREDLRRGFCRSRERLNNLLNMVSSFGCARSGDHRIGRMPPAGMSSTGGWHGWRWPEWASPLPRSRRPKKPGSPP